MELNRIHFVCGRCASTHFVLFNYKKDFSDRRRRKWTFLLEWGMCECTVRGALTHCMRYLRSWITKRMSLLLGSTRRIPWGIEANQSLMLNVTTFDPGVSLAVGLAAEFAPTLQRHAAAPCRATPLHAMPVAPAGFQYTYCMRLEAVFNNPPEYWFVINMPRLSTIKQTYFELNWRLKYSLAVDCLRKKIARAYGNTKFRMLPFLSGKLNAIK